MTARMSRATTEMQGRHYRYDPELDAAADLLEKGSPDVAKLDPRTRANAADHLHFRKAYRSAVAAGDLPDNEGPHTYQKMDW